MSAAAAQPYARWGGADEARVRRSAMVSLSAHGVLVALYLLLRLTHPPQENLVLTQVEFLDLQPQARPEPEASAPRGVGALLRGALPVFRPSPSQEGGLQEARSMEETPSALPQAKPLRLEDKGALNRSPSIRLDSPAAGAASAASLADLAQPSARSSAGQAFMAEAPGKALNLEAAGRLAARPAGGSAIRIDPGASVARGAVLGEFAPRGTPGKAVPSAGLQEGAIDLGGPALARRGGLPASPFPGGSGNVGGGISLAERPVARPAGGLVTELAPRPAPKVEPELGVKGQGLEISGPLAGRKVLSAQLPPYPEWARARGVQADVVIRFFVGPDGRVLERMILERTSGYKELDDLGMEAVRKIIFAPLPKGSQEEQWGIVTLRFRLK